jgi:hypothetical protein
VVHHGLGSLCHRQRAKRTFVDILEILEPRGLDGVDSDHLEHKVVATVHNSL